MTTGIGPSIWFPCSPFKVAKGNRPSPVTNAEIQHLKLVLAKQKRMQFGG
jgi:hypothetical protein